MTIRHHNSLAALEQQVERFNARHALGQRVSVKLGNGESRITTTRSLACVLSGHSAVVWLDDLSGCYQLDRVMPISDEAQPARPRVDQFSAEEMRAAFAEGDSVQQIYARAYRLDRSVTKETVRAILFERADA